MKAKYDKAEANISKICKTLEGYQVQLMKDAALLDKMYQQNLEYYKETEPLYCGRKKEDRGCKDKRTPGNDKESGDQRVPGGYPGGERPGISVCAILKRKSMIWS